MVVGSLNTICSIGYNAYNYQYDNNGFNGDNASNAMMKAMYVMPISTVMAATSTVVAKKKGPLQFANISGAEDWIFMKFYT